MTCVYFLKQIVWLTGCDTGWVMQPLVSLECPPKISFHHSISHLIIPLPPCLLFESVFCSFQGVINLKPGKISCIT